MRQDAGSRAASAPQTYADCVVVEGHTGEDARIGVETVPMTLRLVHALSAQGLDIQITPLKGGRILGEDVAVSSKLPDQFGFQVLLRR